MKQALLTLSRIEKLCPARRDSLSVIAVSFLLALIAGLGQASDEDLVVILESAIQRGQACHLRFDDYDLAGALQCFETIYGTAEHDLVKSMARQGTALTREREGDYQSAVREMQEAIRLAHPYDSAALYMARLLAGYSRLLLHFEQLDLAEEYLGKAREFYDVYVEVVGEDHPETGFVVNQQRARFYLATGRFDEASNYATRALGKAEEVPELDPSATYLILAKAAFALDHLESSLRYSSRACDSEGAGPAVVEGCTMAARLFISNDRRIDAKQSVAKARAKVEAAKWEDPELASRVDEVEELFDQD